jgi:branched-chain amino acid transport system ATP-binding protein
VTGSTAGAGLPSGGSPVAETPILRVRGLDVHRGEAHILHGVEFDVAPRRVTALLGRNGVGKTTTLLSLLGLLPSTGEVVFDGEPLEGLPTHRRVQRGMAYVPEDREVFTQLTVAENLKLAMQWPESPGRLPMVHELFPELDQRSAQKAGSLSGGQQQMLALGRALLHPAKLLLIDEPTKGLAPIVINEVVAALRRATADATVLLVEQNLRVAEALATDAIVLDEGRVVWRGAMDALLADTDLTRSLLGVGRSSAAQESGRSSAAQESGRSSAAQESGRSGHEGGRA